MTIKFIIQITGSRDWTNKERYHNEPGRREQVLKYQADYRNANPELTKQRKRAEYQRNREKRIATNQAWVKTNKSIVRQIKRRYKVKRKAWELNGSFTEAQWQELLDRYHHLCLCCGRKDVDLTQDHVVPLNRGGTNFIENIQPLCGPCNSTKHTKTIDYRTNNDTPGSFPS